MSSAFYSLYELQCELIHHYSPNTDNWTISRKKSNLNKYQIVLHEKIIIESSIKTIGKERKVAQSCPTLRNPIDCSLPGSPVHGIFQARILEWIAISFSRESSRPRHRTQVSHIVDRRFTIWATREGIKKKKNRTCSLITALSSVATIWIFSQTFITEPRDYVCVLSHIWLFVTPWTVAHQAPLPGIFQARILEQVAISRSRGSSQFRVWTCITLDTTKLNIKKRGPLKQD